MAQMSKIEKSISESFAEKEHSISLVNRSKMSLSGVNDVSEFSDSQVMLKTSMGGLCIKGKNLSINQLNTDTGMLDVKGEIHSIQYINKGKDGFFAGLFNDKPRSICISCDDYMRRCVGGCI